MRADGRRCVLVTGIGGNVGQGILRNLRALDLDLYIVGTDIGTLTAGHRYCDAFHRVPYAYDAAYAAAVTGTCQQEAVDLIIPATDYEVYHLGLLREQLPTVLASPPEVARMCLDKYENHRLFQQHGIPFADSALPSHYAGRWGQIVVKPREGRGSRGVHVNPPDWRGFDDTFVVQPRLLGPEITTAFYVDRHGVLVGAITLRRSLEAGMTSRAAVTRDHDAAMGAIIERIVAAFPVRGPCNVQSIVTAAGPVPFELNCRYSGTNSIRAHFGFPDVRWGVEEYLLNKRPDPPVIKRGVALRIYLDIIYQDQDEDEIQPGPARSYVF